MARQFMLPNGRINFRDEEMTLDEVQIMLDSVWDELGPDAKIRFHLREEGEEYLGEDGDIILLVEA
jgi:hypothetical protein